MDNKRLFSTKEAAEYLGIGQTALRTHIIDKGKLRPVILFSGAKKFRFEKSDLDALIDASDKLPVQS